MNPAFIPHNEVAKRLGISATTLYDKRPALEAEGFPRPDPLLKRYHRDDVEAWIRGRRKLADPDTLMGESGPGIDYDAL